MATFKVNDVSPSKDRLPQGNVEAIIRYRCGNVKPESHSDIGQSVGERGLIRLKGIDNALVSAVHLAWSSHYPLVLTPDVIWLCIAQGLARHINTDDNAEKLRHLFVEHESKKTLTVRRDDFIKGRQSNPWPEVFEEFSAQIKKHVGDKTHDLLTPKFSTTGPVERAAAQVVMMNCFKQYFEYGFAMCICGIPEITLEGTVDDWKALREKALALTEYDLGWWVEAMRPVLDQFVAAASGDVDRQFWCRIYHQYGGERAYEPGPYVTGWILVFFPYLHRSEEEVFRNPCLTLWQIKEPSSHKLKPMIHRFRKMAKKTDLGSEDTEESDDESDDDNIPANPTGAHNRGVLHGSFPRGVVSTPFVWEYLMERFPMHFYAGFMAISQDPQTLAVRPEIGWAVASDKELQATKNYIQRGQFGWLSEIKPRPDGTKTRDVTDKIPLPVPAPTPQVGGSRKSTHTV